MKIAAFLLPAACIVIVLAAQSPTYVGSKACGVCHKTKSQGRQLPIWEESGHSRSRVALSGESARRMADDAARNAACLSCHAPLWEKEPRFMEEGVTCEACHGPGSVYKSIRLMSDREEAAKNGLIVFKDAEAIKLLCLKCHKDAHGIALDFESAWAKIRHPIPNK